MPRLRAFLYRLSNASLLWSVMQCGVLAAALGWFAVLRGSVRPPVWGMTALDLLVALFVALALVRLALVLLVSAHSPFARVRHRTARAVLTVDLLRRGCSPAAIAQVLDCVPPGPLPDTFTDRRLRAALGVFPNEPESSVRPSGPRADIGPPHLAPAADGPAPAPAVWAARRLPAGDDDAPWRRSPLIRAYASLDDAQAAGWEFAHVIGTLGATVIHQWAALNGAVWTFDGVADPSPVVPEHRRQFGRLRYALVPDEQAPNGLESWVEVWTRDRGASASVVIAP